MTPFQKEHLVNLANRLQIDYPSEFEWTDKDYTVLKDVLVDLLLTFSSVGEKDVWVSFDHDEAKYIIDRILSFGEAMYQAGMYKLPKKDDEAGSIFSELEGIIKLRLPVDKGNHEPIH